MGGHRGLDEAVVDGALVGLLWDVPLAEAPTRMVIPFLGQLGDRWEDGSLSVAHEHFACNLLRRRLSAPSHQQEVLPQPGLPRSRVLLACPPGERHDLVLLCFSLLLGGRGPAPAHRPGRGAGPPRAPRPRLTSMRAVAPGRRTEPPKDA